MEPRYILFVGAHPDDAESAAGGTLARLAEQGHRVMMLSVTNGDAGHYSEEYRADRGRLAARRRLEAAAAAAVIGAEAASLDVHDGEVVVDLETTRKVICAIRSFGPPGQGPDLIITHRPVDYHRDHRYTSRLVLDAAYMLTVPLCCPETQHLNREPVIAYHSDSFSEEAAFQPEVMVDIEHALEKKARMLAAHASQFFEWLPYSRGQIQEVPDDEAGRSAMMMDHVMRQGGARRDLARGAALRIRPHGNVSYAELFQISEYGRRPDDAELRQLFPIA